MTTLADSFLDDLNELDSSGSEDEEVENEKEQLISDKKITDQAKESKEGKPQVVERNHKLESKIKALRNTDDFQRIVADVKGNVDSGYKLVMSCNELIFKTDEAMQDIYQILTEIYSAKFPELPSLVTDSFDYVRTVKLIGNKMDMTSVDLQSILPSALVMSVSVTGSTTEGKPLNDSDLNLAMIACDEILELNRIKKEVLLPYISSQIAFIAPNTTALVGSSTAALILGIAGGLAKLSKIPAGNILLLGKSENALSGFSRISAMRHTGVLYHCPLVQNCAPKHRRKALRTVSGRLALCARMDLNLKGASRRGDKGLFWHDEIAEKTKKWAAPPPGKTKQALPDPEPKKKTKRAGRRVRKRKELYEQTELHKQANRLQFGEAEDEYGESSMGKGFGMLGKEGGGKIRIVAKARKHEAKLPKYLQNKNKSQLQNSIRQLKAINAGSSGATSGIASSIAFTPVQGIELVNPEAQKEKIRQANLRYFGDQSFKK
mmetsp:Transcript_17730/g.21518  ORF Transcript_17730/g.21518 Transcript_17730/m.21518 type:complete len:491 (+) Transcript_17730:128-1600(+)